MWSYSRKLSQCVLFLGKVLLLQGSAVLTVRYGSCLQGGSINKLDYDLTFDFSTFSFPVYSFLIQLRSAHVTQLKYCIALEEKFVYSLQANNQLNPVCC